MTNGTSDLRVNNQARYDLKWFNKKELMPVTRNLSNNPWLEWTWILEKIYLATVW